MQSPYKRRARSTDTLLRPSLGDFLGVLLSFPCGTKWIDHSLCIAAWVLFPLLRGASCFIEYWLLGTCCYAYHRWKYPIYRSPPPRLVRPLTPEDVSVAISIAKALREEAQKLQGHRRQCCSAKQLCKHKLLSWWRNEMIERWAVEVMK